ncbi:hypothetical protein BD410DRAFT_754900 [Rickenella mellea]|uniref:SH3 domain-containing protein n=1 Tax=Rickenella mellea TaxID=50990 RepID=A0A4Y7PQQ9_9AGAM|nr:hypothetical protein BD410DRAFT_754900 [Rickenella mellea]
MSTRRQPSTTSLSRYARAHSPDLTNRSLDFCNAFWGQADGGVDVLLARMRGAGRAMEELRGFWKERAAIEEDYGKRLSKLAKQTLGRDEIGELRNSLDTLRLETDKQATAHLELARQVRTEMEEPATAFVTKQLSFKKTHQAAIEKQFKAKQTQESYVNKAREKYEADCLRINSFTAQSTLVQGKDLEKLNLKLERAKQTVTANERDFANFARALQFTVLKWEKDWKAFCDGCQDLEEERIEFMKDNVWAYANAVSTVCVQDDESCEHIRVALEQLEPDRDMENFVRDYGTGNHIPEAPQFVNHADASSAAPTRPPVRLASYPRSSQRQATMAQIMRAPAPEEVEPTNAGSAGIGAGSSRTREVEPPSRSNTQSRASSRSRSASVAVANGTGSAGPSPSGAASSSASINNAPPVHPAAFRPSYDPQAQPINPSHQTMLAVGEHAYPVDIDKDPQEAQSSSRGAAGPSGAGPSGSSAVNRVGDEGDPLAKQMEELRNAAGSVRKNTMSKASARNPGRGGSMEQQQQHAGPSSSQSQAPSPASALSPPAGSSSAQQREQRDYRNSAEIVVGAYPGGASSPSAPSPVFMQPPSGQHSGTSLPVEEVLASYEATFPGERKSLSRSNSRASTGPGAGAHAQNAGSSIDRPKSREGHAGIGAQGRSPSPALAMFNGPPPASPTSPAKRQSIPRPDTRGAPGQQRAPSPGISLDASGRVTQDDMAQRYAQQQQQQQQQYGQPGPGPGPGPSPVQGQGPGPGPQRRQSYAAPPPPVVAPPPPQPNYNAPSYAAPPPPATHPQQHIPGYAAPQPPQPQTPYYNAPPAPYAAPPPPQQAPQPPYAPPPPAGYPTQPQQQPNGAQYYSSNGNLASPQNGRHPNPGYAPQGQGFRPPSPAVARTPSPAPLQSEPPTRQYIDGRPVLFYVKALYDYSATIDEEFDFQSGDVIAVTSTPEDGWWTGVLLDDTRRIPGRTVFPSNFVCLF